MSVLLAAAIALAPCDIKDVGPARCGTIQVRENRAGRGRMIGLNTIVLPARNMPAHDAIVILQGGPGQAATRLADFYARVFDGARDERDIVLVDQRGTGQSNPLNCDVAANVLFPADKVAACRDALKSHANLLLYTTAEAVADLDDVRRSLGYDKLDLYGTSYGTRVAFEYARRYPQHTRSIIVKGVVSPTMRYTVDSALDTETSLNRVIKEAEPEYPKLREELNAFLASLPKDGLTRDDVGFLIRNALHSLPGVKALPAQIHAANAAEWADRVHAQYAAISRELSIGMYLSVICAEDMWRVTDADAKRLTAGTVTGDYWQRQLSAACGVWPHKVPQKEVATVLRSDVPTLLISGGYDPVTPPHEAEDAARGLRNSRHVIVKYGSHSFAGMAGCVDKIMSAFVVNPDPAKVDPSCVDGVRPDPITPGRP